MKDAKPIFGSNKLQSFIDFFTNTGKVRFGLEETKLFFEKNGVKVYLTDQQGNLSAIDDDAVSTSKIVDAAVTTAKLASTLDLTGKTVSFFKTGTPVNAVAADDIILTFTDGSIQGEYFEFGDDLYEIDIDATGTAQAGAIAVALVTGSVTKEDAGAAFKVAFDASGTEDWTCVDNADGTVTMTPGTAGVVNNGLTTDATNAAHASFDTATSINGIDGTVGAANEVLTDRTNIYIATAVNTIADANWKKLVLQSL